MKRFLIANVIFVLLIAAVAAGYWFMHRTGSSAHDGPTSETAGPEIDYYTCSMHPYLREPQPGNCPACGMKLQPVYKNTGQASGDSSAHGTVKVSLEEERLLGVRTVRAIRNRMSGEIRTVGRVEVNEGALHHVHTRFEGWIERLFVNTVGQTVKRGDPLFSIYAPKLVASQEEYLLSLRAKNALGAGADLESREQADRLVSAARDRLKLWNMPDDSIDELARVGQVARDVTIRSTVSGVVLTRNVAAGQQVMPDVDMLVIADLSRIWVIADVFERDLARIRNGLHVTASFSSMPGTQFHGEVTFIYPTIDEATRTNRVRIELANTGTLLKPGMFGDIVITSGTADSALVVPADAVMITGERNIVFKKVGQGSYAPVPVKIGSSAGGYYEILEGLSEGDEVVERGQFFLDSESQLRMTGAAGGHQGHGGDQTRASSTSEAPVAESANSTTPATGTTTIMPADHAGH